MAQYELSEDNLNHILEALDYYWELLSDDALFGANIDLREAFKPFESVYNALGVNYTPLDEEEMEKCMKFIHK